MRLDIQIFYILCAIAISTVNESAPTD